MKVTDDLFLVSFGEDELGRCVAEPVAGCLVDFQRLLGVPVCLGVLQLGEVAVGDCLELRLDLQPRAA